MSQFKQFLKHWLIDTRDPIWLLGIVLVAFVATHRPPESNSALIMVDDRDFFHCPASGCWWKVRDEMSWADLARRTEADEVQLRADNPQVSRDVLEAGQLIRLRRR